MQYLLRRHAAGGRPAAGDHVLFHAAAGGVGLIACQWARSLDLKLIGTAGSDENARSRSSMVQSHAINLPQRDFREAGGRDHRRPEGEGGVRLGGQDTFARSLDCLRPFGLAACFGASSQAAGHRAGAAGQGSLYVTRPTLFQPHRLARDDAGHGRRAVRRGGQRRVKIPVTRRYPGRRGPGAPRDLESRTTTGCLVLLPRLAVRPAGGPAW